MGYWLGQWQHLFFFMDECCRGEYSVLLTSTLSLKYQFFEKTEKVVDKHTDDVEKNRQPEVEELTRKLGTSQG